MPACRLVIFGQRKILDTWAEILNFSSGLMESPAGDKEIIVEETGEPLIEIKPGSPSAENGLASFSFFKAGVEAAIRGRIQALVTCPISKTSWQLAGIKYRGHTEYLESLFPEAIMSFWSERMRVALFTHHVALKEAIGLVKKERLLGFLVSLSRHLKRWNFGIEEILVCGLNPHAGESGTMGLEEKEAIIPAITEACALGLNVQGPFPPDTVFLQVLDQPERILVCLYHDQALIPFKLLSFESGVNLTLGLPFIRTSPDHGTAFDLAGRGLASARSLREALWLAWKIAQGKPGE